MTEIPNNYNTLTLGQWKTVQDLCRQEWEQDLDLQVAIIAALTGAERDEILDLPLSEYQALAYRIRFLTEMPKGNAARVCKTYQIGTRTKKWTLRPSSDINRLTAAQYIDFQNFANADPEDLAALLSCVLVPDGCKYCNGYEPAELQDALREAMTVQQALDLSAFFFGRLKRSIAATLIYSKFRLKRKARTAKTETERREIQKTLAAVERMISGGGGDGSRL